MPLIEFIAIVLATVAFGAFVILLPAIITGEWHKDRIEQMMRGEFPGV